MLFSILVFMKFSKGMQSSPTITVDNVRGYEQHMLQLLGLQYVACHWVLISVKY